MTTWRSNARPVVRMAGWVYCSGCVRAALEVAIGLTTGPQCVERPVVAEPLCRALVGLA